LGIRGIAGIQAPQPIQRFSNSVQEWSIAALRVRSCQHAVPQGCREAICWLKVSTLRGCRTSACDRSGGSRSGPCPSEARSAVRMVRVALDQSFAAVEARMWMGMIMEDQAEAVNTASARRVLLALSQRVRSSSSHCRPFEATGCGLPVPRSEASRPTRRGRLPVEPRRRGNGPGTGIRRATSGSVSGRSAQRRILGREVGQTARGQSELCPACH
jgi:hypothetical protein